MDDDATRLAEVLAPMSRLLRGAVRADPPLAPLPYAQVEVLRVVQADPGVSVGGVAASLHLAPNTVSTLVRALVESGLVRQRAVPNSGRRTTLTLTDQARGVLEVWDTHRAELVTQVLEDMGSSTRRALLAALPALDELHRLLRRRLTPPALSHGEKGTVSGLETPTSTPPSQRETRPES